jgi:RimJ/RimL family protein N-acetyltransferase
MQIEIPTLQTERLLLLPPDRSHFETWVTLYSTPHIMEHIGEPRDLAQVLEMLAGRIGHWHLRGFGSWTLQERDSGELCGVAGLKQAQGIPDVEIGWMLLPQYRGRGLAREAARAIIDFAFEQVGAARIVARIVPRNLGSISVAQKVGLLRDEVMSVPDLLAFVGYPRSAAG